jgi:hypothetical protein
VAVGGLSGERLIMTSPNGITWTTRVLDSSAYALQAVTYGSSLFVAVGNSGALTTSTNGISWTPRSSNTTHALHGVAYGNGVYAAIGDYGTSTTSSNGVNWTAKTTSPNPTLNALTFGKGIFVAVGTGGVIWTSTNGSSWTPQTSTVTDTLYGVTYSPTAGVFVAVGDHFTIVTSTDGSTWKKRFSNTTTYNYALYGASFGGNTFVVGGNSGYIAESGLVLPSTPTGFTATSVSGSEIDLTWKDQSNNELNNKIYRKAGAAAFALLQTTAKNSVSYNDTTASGNSSTTAYQYYIKACNSYGCSANSKYAVVPFAPTLYSATPSAGQINLSWSNVANETGYQVLRKPGLCGAAGSWSVVKTTAKDIVTWTNTGLPSKASYSYKVRAFAQTSDPVASGYSSYSNCEDATTP